MQPLFCAVLLTAACGPLPDEPAEEPPSIDGSPFEDGILDRAYASAEPEGHALLRGLFSPSDVPWFSRLRPGPTQCLGTGTQYLITTEVRRDDAGRCYLNPQFKDRVVSLFESTDRFGTTECFATLWAPVLSRELSETCGARFARDHAGTTCNGLVGPGCAWHDDDRKADFLFFRVHDGGYTVNALVHDVCVAYSFYDPETMAKRDGFKEANNPIPQLVRYPVDSDRFAREIRPGEICADEFAWGIYDVTGVDPNVFGALPLGLDYLFGALAVLNPGRGPGDRCDGSFDDAIGGDVARAHDLEDRIAACDSI